MHGNARLTPRGRLTMVLRIESGRPIAHVAREMGVSRPTGSKWWHRWLDGGLEGLVDRSSRPHTSPNRTSDEIAAQIAELRRVLKLGPVRIGWRLGVPASTVQRVLVRLGLGRLAWMDRPTGEVIRRYEHERPGDLVHVDIKKLGKIPDGGGWRAVGRTQGQKNTTKGRVGYDFVHSAVDDCSRWRSARSTRTNARRPAPSSGNTPQRSSLRTASPSSEYSPTNGSAYRSRAWADALGVIKHKRTRPYRPQTNGKVERFNRTLLEEWAYVRTYASTTERTEALDSWLHTYNHHRRHTAIGGQTPAQRANNLAGQYN